MPTCSSSPNHRIQSVQRSACACCPTRHGTPSGTHWSTLDRLAALDETIEVRPDDRFVDDGDVITAAGVSAGIDMALHLVARLDSSDAARRVKRGIQYDPQPPV
jgi:transcriptional regulator GlxA family with amidase domain